MKRKLLLSFFLFLFTQSHSYSQNQIALLPDGTKVILYADKTWAYYEGLSYNFDFDQLVDNRIPDFLRQGIPADKETIKVAIEMYTQGWRFTMPKPKSSQARWGNGDGRTTWWNGYWYNNKTLEYSRNTPQKSANGYYDGDEQRDRDTWRNGGSPEYPSIVQWLLSSGNGIKPINNQKEKTKIHRNRNIRY